MGTLQQALENPTTDGTQRNRQTAAPANVTKPRVEDAILAAVEAIKKRREVTAHQQASQIEAADQEAANEQVAIFREEEETVAFDLAQAQKRQGRHPKGSLQAKEIANKIDQLTEAQTTILAGLNAIEASNHAAYTEGTKRYNTRQDALQTAAANRKLIGSATAADIRSRIAGGVKEEFLTELTPEQKAKYEENYCVVFPFDRKHYGSVKPHDPSVSDVAASLKELVDDLGDRNETSDNKIIAELIRGGFYISARRDPDGRGGQLQSELDLFRDVENPTRKTSEFLSGNGRYYVARVGGGFIVLENRGGEFFAVKASSARAGRFLFTRPDRSSPVAGTRVAANSAPKINQAGTTVTATDVSGVSDNQLRLALEEDLRRETESAERREAADELRDISNIENPLTFSELAEGGTGSAPVSISYEDPETGRRNTVTFQVTGNGTTFSVTGTVPGTEKTIKRVKHDRTTRKVVSSKPFLPDFIGKETPLGVLEQDPLWRLVRELNRPFERDWQLTREAERRNAVPVTAENLGGLTATTIEGAGGIYAVRAIIRKNVAERGQKPEYRYNPVGYIVERKGSKVSIVWAVPGTSVAFANELRGELEISNLPWRAKLILGNVFWTIRKTDGPEHLRLSKKQEETNNTEK